MFAKYMTCRAATRGMAGSACRKKYLALQVTMALASLSCVGAAMAQSASGSTPATVAGGAAQTGQSGDTAPPSSKKAVSLQAVTVTGSNIRSVDVEAAQPVVTITAQDIQKQGFATVGQLLQNVSSMSPPDLSRSAPGDLGPNQGGSFIDLRGLGAMRTLVLVDGQRIGAAHGGYTNINVIPTAIVDHIDVLATGASAVYGSDAIAGVVNIITKKNFNGVQLDTYDGQYMPHADGRQTQNSVTFGKSTDKGGVILSASYQNQGAVWANDRSFSAYPYTAQHPYYGLSEYGTQPMILNAPGSTYADGSPRPLVLNQGGNPMNLADYHPFVQPTYGANGDVVNPGDQNYNNNANRQTMLLTEDKTKNLYLDAHYKITDNITFKFNYGYNADYEYAKSGAPLFYSGMGSNAAYPSLLSPYSYYNPLYGVQGLKIAQRITDESYNSYNDPKNYRYSFGLDGVFGLGEHQFNWDVYMYDSKISGVNTRTGYFNLINVANALGPSFMQNGSVVCGTPGHVIGGCVPINPLAPLTSKMLNYISINSVEHYGSDERAWAADFGGDLFELPGGDFTFSTGVTHRDESGYDSPDPFAYAGYSTDGGVGPNSGGYDLNEAYAEINAPLLKDLPGAQALSLDVATRYSHYSNFGSTTNSSFKLTWKPINDVLVRASYGTGFRAPTVNDLYQGRYPAGTFTDPCDAVYGPSAYGQSSLVAQRCLSGYGGLQGVPANFRQTDNTGLPITTPDGEGAQPNTNFTGGNANLKPETSYNGDIGIVYSPSWLPGFDATVDWWSYNIRNLITNISNDQLLADCYQYSIQSACGQFKRDPGTGQIYDMLNLETNAGWLKERGYDFSFNYRFPETRLGKFKLGMNGTYITAFNMLPTIGSNIIYMAGNTQNYYTSWRLRNNLTLSWSWHDFGASWTARYFSPYKVDCALDPSNGPTPFPCTLPNYYAPGVGPMPQTQIPSITFNDVQVYWNAPWNATFSLGANDIFNRVSPNVYGGYQSGDTPFDFNPSYDLGRFVYMRYQQRF
ncbi:TonB-dependent receptor [Dyella jejuensis]|uniref:TonB-dependent receptor n=1 Tax=Dyella jejuensis TaxID=1432009 RepID=A0ABW8JE54_9GAMM